MLFKSKTVITSFILTAFLFVQCGKKKQNIDAMVKERNVDALASVIQKGSLNNKIKAAKGLIKLNRISILVSSLNSIKSDNAKLNKIVTELLKSLKFSGNEENDVKIKDGLTALWAFADETSKKQIAVSVMNWFAENMNTRKSSGTYKFYKSVQVLWMSLDKNTKEKVAKAHAVWVMNDFKNRGEDGSYMYAIITNPKFKNKKIQKIYKDYFNYFKKYIVKITISKYSSTNPKEMQEILSDILTDYATDKEKKEAGKKLLKEMIKTRKLTAYSLRSLGDLNPPGAVKYLKIFAKPGIKKELLDAANIALTVIRDNPESTNILYAEFKPLLKYFAKTGNITPKQQEAALSAYKGLIFQRKCNLPESEYKLILKALKTKQPAEVDRLRSGLITGIYRLMLCTGGKKALNYIINSIKFPIDFSSVTAVVSTFGSLDSKILLKELKINLKSRKTEKKLTALLALGAYGSKKDIPILEKLKSDTSIIPGWNKTVGDLASDIILMLQKK